MHSTIHFNTQNSIIERIQHPILDQHRTELYIKRDDLIHEEVSGNKWRKLEFNLLKAKEDKRAGIVTFGGAFSNHLVATAAACQFFGLKSIGYVRGEELSDSSNDTLKRCKNYGMDLVFISREEYAMKDEKFYIENVAIDHPNFHIVPEGGANYYGLLGCQAILKDMPRDISKIFVAQGTTTTSLGIATALPEGVELNVVLALKGFDSLLEMRAMAGRAGFESEYVEEILQHVNVLSDYHFGGYGKYDSDLLTFIREFYMQHRIKLDPVYTGKTMFALYDLLEKGELDNQKVLFIHTGGVQGSASIEKLANFKLYEE